MPNLLKMYDKNLKREIVNLSDGEYIVNHLFDEKGQNERTITIKNGLVNTCKYSFTQKNFFNVNKIIKKTNNNINNVQIRN